MNPLAKNSILLNLHLSMWTGEVSDRTALAVVAEAFDNSDVKDDRYKKALFIGDPLKQIKRANGRLRLHFYKETLPWLDGGNGRLIPSRSFRDFSLRHRELKDEFYQAVDEFIGKYAEHVELAKQNKKQLFHEDEYPDVSQIRERFAVNLGALPFPSAADFRVEAPEEIIKELQKSAQDSIASVSKTVETELKARIYARLDMIRLGLTEKSRFKNATFTDSAETVAMVRSLEECLSKTFLKLVARFERNILSLDPDEVRESQELQADVVKECEALLKPSFK